MSRSTPLRIMMQSIDIMVSAMEIYNKPNFSYRDETFCILATNAWELMLKAKIISNNNDKMSSIYIKNILKTKTAQSLKAGHMPRIDQAIV